MKATGAELIMRLLERQGITIAAGIPGGASLPLYDALRTSRIRHVLARHEQGAAFIAQGMARATGRAAVCFGTSGPGATNLLTGIADAKLDSIPLIAVTGQVSRGMIGTDAFQEVDTYGLTVPITKHNYLARSAGELLEVIPDAFRIATSGRPGPVVVDVPKDVQMETVEFARFPEPGRPDPPPPVDRADIARAATLLNTAERPVLLVGAGVIGSGASPALRRLAERAGIPVAATLLGLGVLPDEHPLFLGMVGMHAARATNLVLEECDLLIGLGIRFDDRATGKASEFCPRARILHVDIDPSELGKIKQPTLGLVADGNRAARPAPRSSRRTRARHSAHGWRRSARLIRWRPPARTTPASRTASSVTPPHSRGPEAIVTSDVGQHQMWAAQAFPFSYPRRSDLRRPGHDGLQATGRDRRCPRAARSSRRVLHG